MTTGINKKNRGYTLLETVVYVGIFSILIISVFGMVVSFTKAFVHAKAYNEVNISGGVAMERIIREIRTASSVNLAGSTLDVNPSTLTLNTTDVADVAKIITFYEDDVNKTINIIDDSVDKGSLTGSNVEVTNLIFRNVTTAKGGLIKIEMTIQSKKVPVVTVNFYDSAVFRGSY